MTRKTKASGQNSSGGRRPNAAGKEDSAFYEALGRAIKVARAQLDLERKDLAERAGVSYAFLSDIETGRSRLSSKTLLSIAEALGKAPHELMREAQAYQDGTWSSELERPITEELRTMAAMSASQDPSRSERSSWFHRDRSEMLSDGIARQSAAKPSGETVAKGDVVDMRMELDAMLNNLPRSDLEIVLALVRRLGGQREE